MRTKFQLFNFDVIVADLHIQKSLLQIIAFSSEHHMHERKTQLLIIPSINDLSTRKEIKKPRKTLK